ncbi:MAG: YeeE/YedE thiosulfate transporter family protein [Polyangiaceae bacterium]
MTADFTPVSALLGGALIGLAASLFLLTHGKVAGISGLFGGLLNPQVEDGPVRFAFVAGLVLAGVFARMFAPGLFAAMPASRPMLVIAIAGLLVGYGTRIGNGCTSGHGVCGISRFSIRSLVATITFIATGAITVAVFGGAS